MQVDYGTPCPSMNPNNTIGVCQILQPVGFLLEFNQTQPSVRQLLIATATSLCFKFAIKKYLQRRVSLAAMSPPVAPRCPRLHLLILFGEIDASQECPSPLRFGKRIPKVQEDIGRRLREIGI